MLDAMCDFSGGYGGTLATETMLVRDVNDGEGACDATAAFLERLRPDVAYVAVPTRPPADDWVRPADEAAVNRCFQRFARCLPRVELLVEYEGTAFGSTGAASDDLLANAETWERVLRKLSVRAMPSTTMTSKCPVGNAMISVA